MAETQSISGAVPEFLLTHRLRRAREFAGLTQEQLAGDTEIGLRSVTNYEKGATVPKRPELISWAMCCRVSLDWLITGNAGPSGEPAMLPDGPQDGPGARSSTDRASDYGSEGERIAA